MAESSTAKAVDYTRLEVPAHYKCGKCGATNCKLWREYQTFRINLRCANCAAETEQKDIRDIDADGRRADKTIPGHRTDQIGWYIPAVPTEDTEQAYWGYTSVPPEGCEWWRRLPTRPQQEARQA